MTITITAAQDGRTVRRVLRQDLLVSATLLGRLKRREGALLLNGAPVFTNAVLRAGDVLTVELSDPAGAGGVPPVPMELEISYEDEEHLIVNKAPPPSRRGNPPWPTAWPTIWAEGGPSTPSAVWTGGPPA